MEYRFLIHRHSPAIRSVGNFTHIPSEPTKCLKARFGLSVPTAQGVSIRAISVRCHCGPSESGFAHSLPNDTKCADSAHRVATCFHSKKTNLFQDRDPTVVTPPAA